MYRKIIFILILITTTFSFSQNRNSGDLIKESFTKYFELPREATYLHLNKTTYIVNENIWFKGYVYNRQLGKAFPETTNVYVGIYDSIGKPIKTSLFLADDGVFKGHIEVDSTFSSGNYYIKAFTNWMKNFKEQDGHVQKIVILNQKPISLHSVPISYDIQFLPEGGNLIMNTTNVVGVKITNQFGYAVPVSNILVLDDQEAQVAQLRVSKFGHGKFNFTPNPERSYFAKVSFLNGSERIVSLPEAQEYGVNISVKNIDRQRIIVSLTTNKDTREKLGDGVFNLLIHRDGLAKRIGLSFPKDALFVSRIIEKKILLKGMNVLTLFDSTETPVLERLFFNSLDMEIPQVDIHELKEEKDSLTIQVKVRKTENKLQNLSISVLPKSSKSYNPKDNIISTFYLTPYVNGFIENPSYYFQEFNQRKEAELDLLLMLQGWSSYEWGNILKYPPKQKFNFENGLSIAGTINNKLSSRDKLYLRMPNKTSSVLNVTDNYFKFSNYYPFKGEKIKFSLVRNNLRLMKPNIQIGSFMPRMNDSIASIWKENNTQAVDFESSIKYISDFFLSDDTIQLEEVTVVEDKRSEVAEKNVFIPKYLKNKVTEVTENIEFRFPYILDIIRSKGYEVREGLAFASTERVVIRVRTVQSFGGVNSTDPDRIFPKPIIYLNDVRLSNFDQLHELPTSEVEAYHIDRTGAGEGVRGSGGVIRIYTRRGGTKAKSIFEEIPEEQVFEYTFAEGFQIPKKFYTPQYGSYKNDSFERFGVIHWIPELRTDENGLASFKIINTGLKDISFFIQGMGLNGALLSSQKSLVSD
ncbi:hypothetical protein [Maribacter sp. R77961]|uniref:hypothetical protein n=1 Tax=Maribacter sp. R77961 TaxID=3093871 RepID=UPI0037C50CA0